MTRTVTKWALIAAGIIALLVTGALALPVSLWRTGEVSLPELVYSPSSRGAAQLARIWIDADAACGTGQHRDPDDCLALLSLATASNINDQHRWHFDRIWQRPGLRNRPGDACAGSGINGRPPASQLSAAARVQGLRCGGAKVP